MQVVCMDGCRLLVNKKGKPSLECSDRFCKTWHVGSGRYKCYSRGLLSWNAHIK